MGNEKTDINILKTKLKTKAYSEKTLLLIFNGLQGDKIDYWIEKLPQLCDFKQDYFKRKIEQNIDCFELPFGANSIFFDISYVNRLVSNLAQKHEITRISNTLADRYVYWTVPMDNAISDSKADPVLIPMRIQNIRYVLIDGNHRVRDFRKNEQTFSYSLVAHKYMTPHCFCDIYSWAAYWISETISGGLPCACAEASLKQLKAK